MTAMPFVSRNACKVPAPVARRRRYLVLGASLAILAGPLAAPAQANDAVKALDSFFATAKEWGASTAEYGEITEPGPNDAILREAKLAWDLAFKIGDADIDIDLRMEVPEVRVHGARIEAEGYAFDKIEYPGALTAHISGGVTEKGERKSFDATLTQYDALTTGYFQPRLEVAEDPQHPVSRFFPVLRAALKTRGDQMFIRLMELTLENQGSTQNDRYEGISYKGIANGRVEEQRIEKMTSVQTFPTSEKDGSDERFKVTQETGPYVVRGTDIRPLLEVLTIVPAGTSESGTLLDSISQTDIKIAVEAGSMSKDPILATIASVGASGLAIDLSAEPFDLGTIGDQAMLGTLPKDEKSLLELARKALGILDGVSVASAEIDTIGVTSDILTGKIDRIGATKASYRGLGGAEISGLDLSIAENKTRIALASLTLADLTLAPLENYVDLAIAAQVAKPGVQQILSVVPMLGRMEIKGLDVASDDLAGPVKLESYTLSMGGFIDPIPTSISLKTVGASLPLDLIEEEEARALFKRLGLTQLAYADEINIRWDPDTQALTIDPITFSIEGGGSATLTAEIGGIPRLVFEAPEHAQMALATATINSARLVVKDARLISAYLEGEAEKAGISAATLANGLADQAAAGMGPIAGTPFAKDAEGAVRAFLVSPEELVVTIAPKSPVPVTQLMALGATAPSGVPDLLGLAISANR